MTKEEFKRYRTLPREIAYYEWKIESLERAAAKVPIVKDKVQSSQKEWPYIQTHETVDAPEPKQYTKIQRNIRRFKRLLSTAEHDLDVLTGMITRIEDSRTRQIMTARYVEGQKMKELVIRFDLTEQHLFRLINETVKKF